MNKEVVLKAIIVRMNQVYEQTHKWKSSAPDKKEAKQEILDLCYAYKEISQNRTSDINKVLEIEKATELW